MKRKREKVITAKWINQVADVMNGLNHKSSMRLISTRRGLVLKIDAKHTPSKGKK